VNDVVNISARGQFSPLGARGEVNNGIIATIHAVIDSVPTKKLSPNFDWSKTSQNAMHSGVKILGHDLA
jgi:hypothetical protein